MSAHTTETQLRLIGKLLLEGDLQRVLAYQHDIFDPELFGV